MTATQTQPQEFLVNLFENARKLAVPNDDNTEYWLASEIAHILSLSPDEFEPKLKEAQQACDDVGYHIADHFIKFTQKTSIGFAHRQKYSDWYLTRTACHLLIQKVDKPDLRTANAYFADRSTHLRTLKALQPRWPFLQNIAPQPQSAPNATKTIKNKTSKRIAIKDRQHKTLLVLPPFGSAKIEPAALKINRAIFEEWQKNGLIEIVEDVTAKTRELALSQKLLQFLLLLSVLDWLFVFFYRFIIPEVWEKGVQTGQPENNFVGILFLFLNFGAALAVRSTYVRQGVTARLRRALALFWGSVMVIIGFILPGFLFIIYVIFFHKNTFQTSELMLGGLIVVLISTATLLPVGFYFLFARQSLGTLRETFFREVMLLDPSIKTIEESITCYGPKVDALYGAGKDGKLGVGTPIPILFNTVLVLLGWLLIVQKTLETLGTDAAITLDNIFGRPLHPLDYGFLGAYFFGINMLFRRYVRADITPKAYSHFSLRIMVTVTLVWTLSTTIFAPADGKSFSTTINLIAFIVGVVPETGMALIFGFLKKAVGGIFVSDLLTELHPLSEL